MTINNNGRVHIGTSFDNQYKLKVSGNTYITGSLRLGSTIDVEQEINDNATAIATNTSNISTNTSNIATNSTNIIQLISDVATNTSNISTNTSNISTNTSNISTNTTDITNLQNNKQDNLTAGTNITISAGNVISATDTDTTYTAGTNITISAGNVISATDTNTVYSTGEGIDITSDVISFDGSTLTQNINTTGSVKGNSLIYVDGGNIKNVQTEIDANATAITTKLTIPTAITRLNANLVGTSGTGVTAVTNGEYMTLSGVTSNIQTQINSKQDTLTAGTNISISAGNVISATDTDTTYTAGTNISISAGNVISATDTNTTYSGGDGINISGTTISVANTIPNDTTIDGSLYRIPQMVFYNFGATGVSNNTFGNGNRWVTLNSTRTTGTSFTSISSGTVTFSLTGYYRIKVAANPQTDGYNDRLAFQVYLRIVEKDGTTTDYDDEAAYNFFGWTYTRNTTDGAHGNIYFEDYIFLGNTSTLEVRTKLDTNNRNFDDTLTNSQMDCKCNLQIERVAESDVVN
jgi:hypothetical protein